VFVRYIEVFVRLIYSSHEKYDFNHGALKLFLVLYWIFIFIVVVLNTFK